MKKLSRPKVTITIDKDAQVIIDLKNFKHPTELVACGVGLIEVILQKEADPDVLKQLLTEFIDDYKTKGGDTNESTN